MHVFYGPVFVLILRLLQYCKRLISEGKGESAHMCRLALAFAGRLRDKNPFRTAGLITFPPPAVFKLLNDTGTYQEDRKLFCTC